MTTREVIWNIEAFRAIIKEKPKDEGIFVDCEVIHDGLGITHFLTPKRCRNCDD